MCPAQSSTWNTSSTNKLKYLEIRSINSADGVLSPRSILLSYFIFYAVELYYLLNHQYSLKTHHKI